MNSRKYSTKKPIVLEVKARQPMHITTLVLDEKVSLHKHGDILKLSIGQESVTVPNQCYDLLRLLLHHHDVYQRTCSALMELPYHSPAIPTYVAITYYYYEVLLAFRQEVTDDAPGANKTWRSAHLNYHFAMALDNNAFSKEMQKATLSKIKRTWVDFKKKRSYKPVDDLDIIQYHQRMCDGKDMCGDTFANHALSVSDMIDAIVTPERRSTPGVIDEETSRQNVRSNNRDGTPERRTTRTSVRNVGTTPMPTTISSTASSHLEEADIDDSVNISEMQEDGPKKRRNTKGSRRAKRAPRRTDAKADNAEGPIHHSSSMTSTRGQAETIVKSGGKSTAARQLVSAAETQDTKKHNFEASQDHDRHNCTSDVIDQNEDIQVTPGVVESIAVRELSVPEDQENYSDYENIDLPSTLEDWEDWNRIAFQNGNSHMFLKLGAWILLRFRQLTKMPIDGDVQGLLIPDHPAAFDIEDHAEYNEALGMTRLYSALAHIDDHPEYLVHIFHEIGKASSDERLGSSHPRIRPLPELPLPHKSMISTNQPSWLQTFPLCHEVDADDQDDQDAEGDVDDDGGGVSGALNEMVISSFQAPGDISDEQDAQKRKRATSNTLSPPNKEGGHGPYKRPKSSTPTPHIPSPPPDVQFMAVDTGHSSNQILGATTHPFQTESVNASPLSIPSPSHSTHEYDMHVVTDEMPRPVFREALQSQDDINEPSEISSENLSEKNSDMQISSASEVNDVAEAIDQYSEDTSTSDVSFMDDDYSGESGTSLRPTHDTGEMREGIANNG